MLYTEIKITSFSQVETIYNLRAKFQQEFFNNT